VSPDVELKACPIGAQSQVSFCIATLGNGLGHEKKGPIDQMDLSIVRLLQNDCQVPLDILAKKLRVLKSTLHYRIKRLENCPTGAVKISAL